MCKRILKDLESVLISGCGVSKYSKNTTLTITICLTVSVKTLHVCVFYTALQNILIVFGFLCTKIKLDIFCTDNEISIMSKLCKNYNMILKV